MTIDQFPKGGEYFYLSSMYQVGGGILLDEGIKVPTSENIYQAGKFLDPDARLAVLNAEDGYSAKKIANRLESTGIAVREDWPEVKLSEMRKAVALKFANGSKLANMLIMTGNEKIEQGNTHGDTFWGVSPPRSNNGQNWLGRILMERRSELSEDLTK